MHRLVGQDRKACIGNISAILARWIKRVLSFLGMFMRGQKKQWNLWHYNVNPSASVLDMPRWVCGFTWKLHTVVFSWFCFRSEWIYFLLFLNNWRTFSFISSLHWLLPDHDWINEKNYLLFLQFLLSKLKKFRQHKQDPIFHLGTHTSRELLASVSLFFFIHMGFGE